ncbi:MAG: hypothetical protein II984_10310 [Clostridia bacterium]|nr:hypothetical protein [Clostridia bacterium]
MSKREKIIYQYLIKLLWLVAILFGALALRLELSVFLGYTLRIEVDATYMLDSLIASGMILGGVSFLSIRYF